jgi:hypothetical protein
MPHYGEQTSHLIFFVMLYSSYKLFNGKVVMNYFVPEWSARLWPATLDMVARKFSIFLQPYLLHMKRKFCRSKP